MVESRIVAFARMAPTAAAAVTTFLSPLASAQTVSGPDQLSCPAVEEVRRELPRTDTTAGWTVTLAEAPGGALARELVMRDASGRVVLGRRFLFQPHDCAAAARAVAIVVERYFRDLQTSREDPPPPEPITRPDPRRTDRPARLVLAAGPVWNGTDPGRLSGSFEVRARLWRFLEGSAALMAPAAHREQRVGEMGGRASRASLPVRLRLLGATSGRLPLSAGIDGLVLFERAQASGVTAAAVQRRLVYLFGPSAGLAVPLPGRWRLGADLGVYRALPAAPFVVQGLGEVLAPAAWRAIAGLHLGWTAL